MKRNSYVVDEFTEGKLKELSKKTTMSMSLIIRLAVKEYYEKYKQ